LPCATSHSPSSSPRPSKPTVTNRPPNDRRHAAATLPLSAGVHPRVVMELLGHSQMRTTTDTYSHVMPELAREAADRMGTTLWGP
jgi:integrase